MSRPLDEPALAQLFTEARSHHRWTAEPVSNETLRRLYDLMKWGPTSVNANPARLLFLRTAEAKERLYPALLASNVEQVQRAPVTAVIAYDERYIDLLPQLFPAFDVKPLFEGDRKLAYDTAFRNSSLQGDRRQLFLPVSDNYSCRSPPRCSSVLIPTPCLLLRALPGLVVVVGRLVQRSRGSCRSRPLSPILVPPPA